MLSFYLLYPLFIWPLLKVIYFSFQKYFWCWHSCLRWSNLCFYFYRNLAPPTRRGFSAPLCTLFFHPKSYKALGHLFVRKVFVHNFESRKFKLLTQKKYGVVKLNPTSLFTAFCQYILNYHFLFESGETVKTIQEKWYF